MIELEKYEILEEIGRGGMAIVYRAKHKLLHSHVAIKVLYPQFTHDEEFLKRFMNGARSAALLKHENIIPVYDVGSEEGNYYIIMECLEGVGLDEEIKREGGFSEERIDAIMRPLASALDYAHDKGVIHRDIKSSNIFLTEGGRVVLMDFDIAKASDLTVNLTQDGTLLGTPAYMSPEQARGEKVESASDIYSFGVVLYEMATGKLPFTGESTFSVLHQIAMGSPSPPREVNEVVSADLDGRILWCMEQNPADRPASAGEIFSTDSTGVEESSAKRKADSAELDESVPGRSRLMPWKRGKAAAKRGADERTERSDHSEASAKGHEAPNPEPEPVAAIAETTTGEAEVKTPPPATTITGVGGDEPPPAEQAPPASAKRKRSKGRSRMLPSMRTIAWIIVIIIVAAVIKGNMFPDDYDFGVRSLFSADEVAGIIPPSSLTPLELSRSDMRKVRNHIRDFEKMIAADRIQRATEELTEIRKIDPGHTFVHEGGQKIYDWYLEQAGNMLEVDDFNGYESNMARAVLFCPSMRMDNLCQRARVYQKRRRIFGGGDTNAAAIYLKILGVHAETMKDWVSSRL
ncbi:MAG: serine/threonine protein kinase [bacterium]|nr:serine/threonine protein kinase [bacterium]